MMDVLAPPFRILLMAGFLLLAKQGWFTWLTPENAHGVANEVMDFLVLAVPAGYALWAGWKEWRDTRAVAIIAKAAALPEVQQIDLASKPLADAIPSPKVTA